MFASHPALDRMDGPLRATYALAWAAGVLLEVPLAASTTLPRLSFVFVILSAMPKLLALINECPRLLWHSMPKDSCKLCAS